ncbi:MAG TPA: hypothetical protein PKH33_05905 [bacterium]|nr:hypothetical protein [bacterium]
MYLVTASLAEDGDVFLAPSDRVVLRKGPGDSWVSKYGIGQSLAQLPAYLFADAVFSDVKTVEPALMKYFIVSFTNAAISAGVCVFVFLLCSALGYGRGVSLYVVALAGFGTMLWPQSKTLFSEPLQALCLTGGFFFAVGWRARGGTARAAAAGFLLGLLIATKPIMGVAAAPVILYFADGLRVKKDFLKSAPAVFAFFGLLAVWVVWVLYYNHIRFGYVFDFGYLGGTDRDGAHGFNTPLLVGLHGLLLSSGKGLVFYAPVAALAILGYRPMAKRFGAEAATIAALSIATAIACAKWNAWHGDYSWGPRFMGPVVPLLAAMFGAALAAERLNHSSLIKAAAATVFVVSLFVNILGVFVNENEFILMTKRHPAFGLPYIEAGVELRDDLLNVHYIPEYSPLAGHWWILKNMVARRGMTDEELSDRMRDDFPWRNLSPSMKPANSARAAQPDAWWHYLPTFFPRSAAWVSPLAWIFAAFSFAFVLSFPAVVLRT